jgi:hypothetical protein
MKYLILLLSLFMAVIAQEEYGQGAVGGNTSSIPSGQAGAFKSGSNFPQGGQSGQHPSSGSNRGSSSYIRQSDPRSMELANYVLIALAGLVVLLFIYRVIISTQRFIRALVCMGKEKQAYFQTPNPYFAMFKKHILYAPLLGNRHMKEFRPLPWLHMGIIPSRMQTLFITAFVGMNATLTVIDIDFGGPEDQVLNKLLARSGTLAVVNLIPLVLMAGKHNPLISILNIPYSTFNMMHRWLGRIVTLESITHAVAWLISSYHRSTNPFCPPPSNPN